jgi:hypothetical protein
MKTTDLVPYGTWIEWNGSLAMVTGVRLNTEGRYVLTMDRFNMCGTRIASPVLIVTPDATWKPVERPKF